MTNQTDLERLMVKSTLYIQSIPETQIWVRHHALRPTVVEVQGWGKSEMHLKHLYVSMTLNIYMSKVP